MYNACVYQQSPDVDAEIDVASLPGSSPTTDASEGLELETAWTNALVWLTAKIMHYCFQSSGPEPRENSRTWQTLTSALDEWEQQKPLTFRPIWQSETDPSADGEYFPRTLFVADWHGGCQA